MIRTLFRNENVSDQPLVRVALAASTLLILLAVIYWPTLYELESRWRNDPSWSHGYAVVPAFLWLVWVTAHRTVLPWQRDLSAKEVAVGSFAMLVGLGLHALSNLYLVRPLALDAISLVLTLLGLLWIVGGRVGARTFGGAVLFLVFMVPLPFTWQQPLAESLQHLVSITSEILLSLFGVPVHREGYLLRLPGQTVEVAEGCSGLRQITLFLAMSVFIGLKNQQRGVWLPLLVLSIPVAIFVNTVRITLTGLIVAFLGTEWATGVFHEVEGLFTFALGLGLLWFAAGRISRWALASAPATQIGAIPNAVMDETKSVPRPSGSGQRGPLPDGRGTDFVRLRIRVAGLFVVLSCGVAADAAEQRWIVKNGNVARIGMVRSLADFPKQFGAWIGADTPVAQKEFLYGEEHLHRVYRHRITGQTLTLWMVYTDDGRDRAHHPEVCMRAIGHSEDLKQRQSVTVPGEGSPVERFFFRRPNGKAGQWVYHWYYIFRDELDMQVSPTLWQRVQRNFRFHRSGLSVEVFAPQVSTGDQVTADEFVSHIAEHLQRHVPQTAARRTARGNYLIVGGGGVVKD